MLKKRFTSLFLALAMVLGLSGQAFAAVDEEYKTTAEIAAAEIEAEKDAIFTNIYVQLEEQGALDFYDTYVEILTPRIEVAVMEKYGLIDVANVAEYSGLRYTYNFPYGALVTYKQAGSLTEVMEVYADPTKTPQLRALYEKKISIVDFLFDVAAHVPVIKDPIDKFNTYVRPFLNKPMEESITNCQQYSMVMTLFDPVSGAGSCVMMGWQGYTSVVVYVDHVVDFEYEQFYQGPLPNDLGI